MLSAMYIPLNPPKSPESQMLICKITPTLQMKKLRLGESETQDTEHNLTSESKFSNI